jgi:hypothetical protein
MAFGTLSDDRAIALAALQELGLTVPEVGGAARAVRRAERLVAAETTRCMRELRERLVRAAHDLDPLGAKGSASGRIARIMVAAQEAGCDAAPAPYDDRTDVDRRLVHR